MPKFKTLRSLRIIKTHAFANTLTSIHFTPRWPGENGSFHTSLWKLENTKVWKYCYINRVLCKWALSPHLALFTRHYLESLLRILFPFVPHTKHSIRQRRNILDFASLFINGLFALPWSLLCGDESFSQKWRVNGNQCISCKAECAVRLVGNERGRSSARSTALS